MHEAFLRSDSSYMYLTAVKKKIRFFFHFNKLTCSCLKSNHQKQSNQQIIFLPYKEAVTHENYQMPFGTYKPYFHGELVTEYRNSLSKIKAQSNGKAGVNPKPILEVYTEPGELYITHLLLSVRFMNPEVFDVEENV